MSALKAKHQRLVLVVVAVIALMGAGLIASYALSNQASYFYVPEMMAEDPPEVGQAVRLGGMVEEGSLRTLEDGVTIAFTVGDGKATRDVRFAGIVPSLFVEGSGVIAEGRLSQDGTFVADNLLAKHDENYVPVELEEMNEHQARQITQEAERKISNSSLNGGVPGT
ncbi:cytochrome c maturation protein CcmE [Sphingomonadaceae bacterium]|nr:cytochrome c maturation protein CcmE [Sphingomonadaceae bacterium]